MFAARFLLVVCVSRSIRHQAEEHGAFLRDMAAWETEIKVRDKKITSKAAKMPAKCLPPVRASGGLVPVGSTSLVPAPPRKKAAAHKNTRALKTPEAAGGGGGAKGAPGGSAAAHTYDKGYKKWEAFDADAAEAEVAADEAAETAAARGHRGGDGDGVSESDSGDEGGERVAVRTPAHVVHGGAAAPVAGGGSDVPRPKPALLSPAERELAERERGNALFKTGDFTGAARSYTACLGISNRSVAAFR